MRGIEKNLLVVSTVDPEQRYYSNQTCQICAIKHSMLASYHRKHVDSSSSQTLVNGVVEGHAVSNIRAAPVHATFSQRPTSAASDVASVSDGSMQITCHILEAHYSFSNLLLQPILEFPILKTKTNPI